MDYKIAYIEILEKLRKFIDCWRNYPPDNVSYEDVIDDLEYRVPELKESEDERIRKGLMEHLNELKEQSVEGSHLKRPEHYDAWIAWLEKQGEQNLANSAKTRKDEPKFKVGDWLVHRKLVGETFHITQINEPYYYLTNLGSFIKFGEEDKYRLWTIKDAKVGDVLYTPKGLGVEGIFLIGGWKQGDVTGRTLCSNIGYRVEDDEIITGGIGAIWWEGVIDPFFPATKEQRDLLFQKMKEAGYEWDAERKEVKKVEQKSVEWSEKDEGIASRIMTALENCESEWCENKKEEKDWLKTLKNRVQPQPKSEWSKEDERLRDFCIAKIEDELEQIRNDKYGHSEIISDLKEGCRERIKWLESLKERYTWKPSDEQMKCLLNAEGVLRADNRIAMAQKLSSLYNDLKALCDK